MQSTLRTGYGWGGGVIMTVKQTYRNSDKETSDRELTALIRVKH